MVSPAGPRLCGTRRTARRSRCKGARNARELRDEPLTGRPALAVAIRYPSLILTKVDGAGANKKLGLADDTRAPRALDIRARSARRAPATDSADENTTRSMNWTAGVERSYRGDARCSKQRFSTPSM